jgi:tRNA-Thr(GGU) m(6)t(6)A37 methyltransferase TsaA
MRIKPIGIIHTPFVLKKGMPIQPFMSKAVGKVIVYKKYQDGLKDIDGFSHITLVYRFHRSRGYKLHVKPFLDDKEKGLFATRAPRRPNQIGISVVKLISRNKNVLTVKGIDVLNSTPLLDIKPYVPDFVPQKTSKIGWLKGKVR